MLLGMVMLALVFDEAGGMGSGRVEVMDSLSVVPILVGIGRFFCSFTEE